MSTRSRRLSLFLVIALAACGKSDPTPTDSSVGPSMAEPDGSTGERADSGPVALDAEVKETGDGAITGSSDSGVVDDFDGGGEASATGSADNGGSNDGPGPVLAK